MPIYNIYQNVSPNVVSLESLIFKKSRKQTNYGGINMEQLYLQMYSFGEFELDQLENQLKSVAEMGYHGVELFGPNLDLDIPTLKKLLEDNHLEAISLHATSNEVVSRIPVAKDLNIKYIVIGMEYLHDLDSVIAFAKQLNEIGELCNHSGITLAYHNHTQEFHKFGEKRIIDILLEETKPEYVSLELDAGWCAAAGYSPIDVIKQYEGRVKLVHVKESSRVIGVQPPFNPADLLFDEEGCPVFSEEQQELMQKSKEINCAAGKGLVNWKELREIADTCGCQGYIVEREYSYANDRLQCLTEDINYYKKSM